VTKLTDRQVRNLKAKRQRYEHWEGNGLGIRVTPRGRKSWVYIYRYRGRARRLTLGRYPAMTVAEAHKAHGAAMAELEKGGDPGGSHVEARQEARRAPTVDGLIDEYLEKWAKPRKRSWAKDEQRLKRHVSPAWGRCKAAQITRRDVISLLDEIVDRGTPVEANRTLAVIRKMYNFAIARDIVATSPCVAIARPGVETRRDRVLSLYELKAFWVGLDKATMAEGTRLALKLVLLTAQRAGEVVNTDWEEVDLTGGWWTIPAAKAKNGLSHRVPLSGPALEVLHRAKTISAESPWAFPSPRDDQAMTENAMGYAVRRNLKPTLGEELPALPISHFTPHDLRRTAASHMTGLGISRLVVAKILNHAESGITAVYDRHGYDAEKRQALDAWGRKLQSIVHEECTNVVRLQSQPG
jgi:integrase